MDHAPDSPTARADSAPGYGAARPGPAADPAPRYDEYPRRLRAKAHPELAAEPPGRYDAEAAGLPGDGGDLAAALADVRRAVDRLADVELRRESGRNVLDASVAIQGELTRLEAQQTRLLATADGAGTFREDGARSLASWYAGHTRLDRTAADRLLRRAKRLRWFPELRAAHLTGDVTSAHLEPILRAAIPQRRGALMEAETALVGLAERGTPREVARAVALVRDNVDPDGTDACELGAGPDVRRDLRMAGTIDGLGIVSGTLAPETRELLSSLLERIADPDGPEVPEDRRRSPGQVRHDAFHEVLNRAASVTGETRHGTPVGVSLMIDLQTLYGADTAATFESSLLHSGTIDDATARRILADAGVDGGHVSFTTVFTSGPYRPVAFGRTRRTLPGWVRTALLGIHRSCRAPYCDLPAVWGEADHTLPWADGGDTDVDNTGMLCTGRDGHHEMVTSGGWSYTVDRVTGAATFTSPTGRRVRTHPPPQRC